MTMSIQIGPGGDDITTLASNTTTLAVMHSRHKRAYGKRKDNGGDTPSTSTSGMKKTKDCGGDKTDTPAVTETKKRAYKRKDCGGDTTAAKRAKDTPTVTETKKRAYQRKDCGGDTPDMPTVTETKKRAYKRKDCRGDTTAAKRVENCGGNTTDTPTVTETKKRATIAVKRVKDCGGNTPSTATVMEIKKKRPYRRKKCLPHDLIFEEVLTRLPVPTLLQSVLVSKLWYHSIHNDHKRLTYSHFLQSQKQPDLVLSLLNVREGVAGEPRYGCHFFKLTTGTMYAGLKNVLQFHKFRGNLADRDLWELVGYCNGLPCMALVRKHSTAYMILDPNRRDFLKIFHPARVGRKHSSHTPIIICHGFGFDHTANEYKLVSIFCTPNKELNFLVFTLGTKSWRDVTPTSMHISGHGGRPILKIRAPTGSDKSAILCSTSSTSSSGCLAWKIIATVGGAGTNGILHDSSNDVGDEMEMEMLLSFNLHGEKFQFSHLPVKSTTDGQQMHLLVDYPHLLGFKGFPCIARIEKITGSGSDPHRCRDDHQGSSSCCCCCKVHLYVLKDNVKQVWVKEEIFDVRVNSADPWARNRASDPCCFCFSSATTPPTRIFSFSDQIFLYWYSGKHLHVYNMRSEKLQLVLPVNGRQDVIFQAKIEEPRHICNSGDDDIYFSNMDYQLHCHEENFLSLQTFIPEGVEGVDADDFLKLDWKREDRPCLGYVCVYRGSKVYYPFYN